MTWYTMSLLVIVCWPLDGSNEKMLLSVVIIHHVHESTNPFLLKISLIWSTKENYCHKMVLLFLLTLEQHIYRGCLVGHSPIRLAFRKKLVSWCQKSRLGALKRLPVSETEVRNGLLFVEMWRGQREWQTIFNNVLSSKINHGCNIFAPHRYAGKKAEIA